ncbi:MAG: peptidase M14 family protein, partial [Candidatus Aminicenantes bacterium]|nr:peptidase M14 family protein [Candidatus Aminicenantes bacterium]
MRQHSKYAFRFSILCLLGLMIFGVNSSWALAQSDITSPKEFFGFRLGSDRKIARWDKIVDYYNLLNSESDKIDVINMGPSTMGNPFLLVIISSKENLSNLDRLKDINAKISNPRGITES